MRELDDITDIREDHRLIWLRVQKAAERGKGLRLTPHEVSVLAARVAHPSAPGSYSENRALAAANKAVARSAFAPGLPKII